MNSSDLTLDAEIRRCKTVRQCADLASVDCYNEDELATSWLTCLEDVFPRGMAVKVLDQNATLERLDLLHDRGVLAVCRKGRRLARVALESVEFSRLSKCQRLWLRDEQAAQLLGQRALGGNVDLERTANETPGSGQLIDSRRGRKRIRRSEIIGRSRISRHFAH